MSEKEGTRNQKHHQATEKPAACASSLSGQYLACDSGAVVYIYSLSFICIGVLCRPCRVKNAKISIWGALVPISFTDPGQI